MVAYIRLWVKKGVKKKNILDDRCLDAEFPEKKPLGCREKGVKYHRQERVPQTKGSVVRDVEVKEPRSTFQSAGAQLLASRLLSNPIPQNSDANLHS